MKLGKNFKIRYIKRFGTDDDKDLFIFSAYQSDKESVGEFTRKLLEIVVSKKNIGNREVHNIVRGIKDLKIQAEIRKKMWKRPKNIPHWSWLSTVIERYEKQTNQKEDSKEKENSTELNLELNKDKASENNDSKITVGTDKSTEHKDNASLQNIEEKDDVKIEQIQQDISEQSKVARTREKKRNMKKKSYSGSKDTKKNSNRSKNNSKDDESNDYETNNENSEENINNLEKDDYEEYREDLLEKLVKEYPDVTNNEVKERKPCTLGICKIETTEGKRISVNSKRRIEQSILNETKKELENLEKAKIIRKSNSEWRSPMRPVRKPNGKIRICTNLIAVNEITEKEEYPTPIMNDLIEKVQGSDWFTVIDLKDGYFQVEIRECDKYKTAFKFDNLLYEWNRMPMGFKNAPSIFQKMMDKLLGDLSGKGVEVYLDDIVIHTKTRKEHEGLLREVFNRLRKNNLYINIKKLQLARKEVNLLGIKVNGTIQKLLRESQKDIQEYPRPENVKSLRRFLGKMNFYSPFIKNMSVIAVPLYEKTGKYTKFEWTKEMEDSFNKLKETLAKEIYLYLPNYNKRFILETDASDTGLGACLMQCDNNGRKVPIRWASRKLTKAEKNYGITEKELLAVIWGIEHFEYQLRGRSFDLITDHIALESMRKKSEFGNKRMSRWIDKIQDYDFTITYKKGSEMLSADAMSRLYEKDNEETDNEKENKKNIVKTIHERLLHRGLASIKYELKKEHNWEDANKLIEEVIKECEVCSKNNRKHSGGCELVETTKIMEKTGIDIMKLGECDTNVLVFIDYYSRLLKLRILRNRTTQEIIEKVKNIFEEIGVPEQMNSDNAKEFTSKEFFNFMTDYGIEHHLTSVEHHTSNGRVERAIRTIRDAIVKTKDLKLNIEENIYEIEHRYNNTFHRGIGVTPNEAFKNKDEMIKDMINNKNEEYAKNFKLRKREEFNIGQCVRIANKENLKNKGKSHDRFQDEGKVIDIAGKDSYLVRDCKGNISKIAHNDIKGIIINP